MPLKFNLYKNGSIDQQFSLKRKLLPGYMLRTGKADACNEGGELAFLPIAIPSSLELIMEYFYE